MYEYKYVTIRTQGAFSAEFKDRRKIIDEYAAEGWRYAGWVPVSLAAYGAIMQIDLIFEREVK